MTYPMSDANDFPSPVFLSLSPSLSPFIEYVFIFLRRWLVQYTPYTTMRYIRIDFYLFAFSPDDYIDEFCIR